MVDKSASADLRATKMLIDMMKDVEDKAGDAAPPREPRRLVQQFVARLRRQIRPEIEERKCRGPPAQGLSKRRAEKRERIPPFAEAGHTTGDRHR